MKVAVLSRGYGRRTKGYLEADVTTSFLNVGDEPKQIKLKFPEIVVAVCESRRKGIETIIKGHPEVDVIILDDGFQHRYIEPWVNIVMVDYNRPVYKDHFLPWGSLRDNVSQLHRAHFIIVTKCPAGMSAIDRRIVQKSLNLYPYQNLYFSSMAQGRAKAIFPEAAGTDELPEGNPVIAMSGIGNPSSFANTVSAGYKIENELVYADHHPYRRRDLETMKRILDDSPEGTAIVTTEKDSVKLSNSKKIPPELQGKLYYIPVKIAFRDETEADFLKKLDYDVRTDPEHRVLRS